ncbi:MAG: hypothetical protein ACJAVI_001277 [Candidatus Azotimanducaceae bacterium]|jgi:hypothetical protein
MPDKKRCKKPQPLGCDLASPVEKPNALLVASDKRQNIGSK